jgi:hypothetical protein
MAEAGLFIGWGEPRAGKELASLTVFEEAIAYYESLRAAGEIESVDTVLLGYHGGDLSGFTLLRGDHEKLGRLTTAPEFRRLTWRASACLAKVGVVPALVDAGVADTLGAWHEGIADLI